MPRQIHQNRELGFGTALERTMTKCHSQYGIFESLMRNEARSKDQTSLLQQLFDDVVTTALKGPIHYIQDDGRNPVFTYVATHAGRRPPFTGRGSIIERYGLLAFPAELWLELNRIAPWLEDSLILEWARLSARFESLCSGEHVLQGADAGRRQHAALGPLSLQRPLEPHARRPRGKRKKVGRHSVRRHSA